MERIEDLMIDNLKIFQNDEFYTFTSDSVLLSKFAKVKKGDIVADFCSGSGIVGLNLYALNKNFIKSITFFELQAELANMSKKTIEINKLTNIINVENCSLQEIDKIYYEKFSLIVCNPPYIEKGRGENNKDLKKAICKTEIKLELCELVNAINKCLKFGGKVDLVYRSDRLCELIVNLKSKNIEPKRLQFVKAKNKKPYIVLIEAVKGGKPGLKIESEICN